MGLIVAIDGEAGAGKSTVAKEVAKLLNFVYVDTGAMFRCVTLDALNKKIDVSNKDGIAEILENIEIKFENDTLGQKVFLNGLDVTDKIRTKDVDDKVAEFAAVGEIREKLKELEQEMGKMGNIVMEGRDIGTTIFPNADVKLYIEVSEEERARRRYNQNLEKGINMSYEEILANIKKRHKLETEREISPLRKAEDAIEIDTTNMTFEESIKRIITIINDVKIGKNLKN